LRVKVSTPERVKVSTPVVNTVRYVAFGLSENFMSCFLAPAGGSLSVSRVTSAAAAAGTRVTRLAAFSAASAIAAALWLALQF